MKSVDPPSRLRSNVQMSPMRVMTKKHLRRVIPNVFLNRSIMEPSADLMEVYDNDDQQLLRSSHHFQTESS